MRRRGLRLTSMILLLTLAAAGGRLLAAAPPAPKDTQAETVALTPPQKAAASFETPEGFHVELFAAEPEVRQPIAITTDARGRLWVAENDTYAEQAVNYDLSQRDRIVILEDTDHDGRSDKRTVFWDQGTRLTSVEVGFGGVWALCPPQLVFLPDRNGDDVPDGAPEVLLEGWNTDVIRHNIVNGLKWGPDGWLYGRHGIQATSRVGPPGTPIDQRVALNCCIWRYHPTRKEFEVVSQGGTNSWGMDWNEFGEPFYINTVIGHLWHAVPGTHYERMYGEDFNPHLYALMKQTADHYHWDRHETWDVVRKVFSPTTDQAGGGHAHTGLLIYQGENWPARYRDTVLTVNYHGRRLNNDRLERAGAGYVGRHAPDLLKTSDPWFRAIDLITGPDGGVYLADWCDIGECHENDGVHRSSGRIFKVTYGEGQPPRPAITDLTAYDDRELVRLQADRNEWYVRQARRVLQERMVAGRPMKAVHEALRAMYRDAPEARVKLRALWALYVTEGTTQPWLLEQLNQENEHVCVWIIRLLIDQGTPAPVVVQALTARAPGERSGLVLLYLASALQKFPLADRWALAEALAAHGEWADDPALPLLTWYGIEPAVPEATARAVALAGSSKMPVLTRFLARRLTEDLKEAPGPVDRLVALAAQSSSDEQRRALLTGMAEALRGWRKAPAPQSWAQLQSAFGGSSDATIARVVRELSVVFGDGRAVQELLGVVGAKSADMAARRDAIRVAVEARAENLVPLLNNLIADRDLGADAIRGLAALGDPGTPALLLKRWRAVRPDARAAAVVALSSRPSWARGLLAAVAAGTVDRAEVPAFQIRQMQGFPDDEVRHRVSELWPELRTIPAAKRARIAQLRSRLDSGTLAAADLPNGRKLFVQTCANCHTLFGSGGKIGPDLTGAQRSDLGYLLENVVDPAATVAADYRMSTLALTDGRLLSGLVSDHGPTLTLQTATERMVINRADVAERRASELSLMPEGQLDVMTAEAIRDLIAYLMSPRQVPLPEGEGSRPQAEGQGSRPNVLLFCIDDLNDWIGCLKGHPQVQTPHMDRLAQRGTLFANAHCQAPLCNPSRTSFLTGLRPSTTGVYALDVWFRTAESWQDAVTLPQHFAAQGYRTLTTGKVIHDAFPPAAARRDGPEFTVWGYHGKYGPRPAKKINPMPGGVALMDWGVFPEHDDEQDDWKVADWAIARIKEAAGEGSTETPSGPGTGNGQNAPFFLSVGFRHPHVPCYATQRWFDLYPKESLILPPVLASDRDDTPRFSWYLHWRLPEPRLKSLQEAAQWEPLVRAYLASTSFVDSQVGRVLDALEASGLAGNTVVALLSDHGWHLGEKGISGKNTLWDRSTRVPLIFAGPGVKAGGVCRQPAELLDLYPTLAALCGLPAPSGQEGHSLVQQLRDDHAPRPWPAITTHGPNNHAVRTERHRYIRYADGSEELYDMAADPNEWTNLADDPAHAATKQELAHWLPSQSAAPLPGHTVRLLENRGGVLYWEGKPIDPEGPIPGIDEPEE